MNHKIVGLSFLFMALLFSCKHSRTSENKITRAFYKWDRMDIDAKENSLLQRLNVKRVYIHFFDVDVHSAGDYPYPVQVYGAYDSQFAINDSIDFVPTVFITNTTFKEMSDSAVENLAKRVEKKIKYRINEMADATQHPNYEYWYTTNPYLNKSDDLRELHCRDSVRKIVYNKVQEIQFDCDWTSSTKDNYFLFLEKMKQRFSDKLVSSTVRLYGYKYPEKAGVPPVEKGMLMCYNAGDVRNLKSPNSIFDKKEILSYLNTNKHYPLPLDYALPIFSWAAVYRSGKLVYLLPLGNFDFEYDNKFQLTENPMHGLPVYKVLIEHTLGYSSDSPLLKEGDLIKIEQPNLLDVAAVAKKLGDANVNPSPVISLYHLQFNEVIKHEKSIQNIYNAF